MNFFIQWFDEKRHQKSRKGRHVDSFGARKILIAPSGAICSRADDLMTRYTTILIPLLMELPVICFSFIYK